jgi:hypothetical protein
MGRVSVYYAPEFGEAPVQHEVRVSVAGRAEVAFDDSAIQVYDHEIACGQVGVRDAARLYHHQALVAIDPADVAPGESHEPVARQQEVSPEDLLAQRF